MKRCAIWCARARKPDRISSAPAEIQQVVRALQALRGVGQLGAVSVVAALGSLSRFSNPRQLMG